MSLLFTKLCEIACEHYGLGSADAVVAALAALPLHASLWAAAIARLVTPAADEAPVSTTHQPCVPSLALLLF